MSRQKETNSEKHLRIQAASRIDDGFFSTFVLRKISRKITGVLVDSSIHPNNVTVISLLLGISAAIFTSQSNYYIGGILFIFALILDCVDGEIARYKKTFSTLGAWLDAITDRLKEYLYIAALIYSAKENKIWNLGIALLILQTLRHLSDYNFAKMQKIHEDQVGHINRSGAKYWLKKVIHLPIGERWILLIILPSIISVKNSITMLLILGGISFAYVILGRARRTKRWEANLSDDKFLLLQRDTLLNYPIQSQKISWALPSLLRGLEFVALLLMTEELSAITRYFLFFAIALWHYTNLYDSLHQENSYGAGWGLRFSGRISLFFLAQLLGLSEEVAIFFILYLTFLILLRGRHNGKMELK